MPVAYSGDNFASLKKHIERLRERGQSKEADELTSHLARLEALAMNPLAKLPDDADERVMDAVLTDEVEQKK